MITSLSLKNFRCFDQISLTDLKRVTVITGASGTGKTALLEAFLIAGKGTPDAVMRANQGRNLPEATIFSHSGVPPFGSGPLVQAFFPVPQQSFYNLWAGIFKDESKPVDISYTDTATTKRNISISLNTTAEAGSSIPLLALAPRDVGLPKGVLFERGVTGGLSETVSVFLGAGSQMVVSAQLENFGPVTFYFASGGNFNEADNVAWLSQLKVGGEAGRVIRLISKDFPIIEGLEVLSPGGVTAVYATMRDGSVRSLSLVSSGIHKTFSLYCGVAALRDGAIILDEVENGIYYEKYESVWRNIYELCSAPNNNQLFVTVHSRECLEALLPTLMGHADDFSLLRTEREGDKCIVRHITGKAMRAALSGEIDLRGTSRNA
jgi:hypothetical protein